MRKESTFFVPNKLFGCQPTSTLYEATFDLPAIDRRVQRAPDIMENISPQNAVLTCQRIDSNLRQRRAISLN